MTSQHTYHGHAHHRGQHHDHHADAGHHHGPAQEAGAMTVVDPVCGMTVDPATSKHRMEHAGSEFHFCSAGCRDKFAADPAGKKPLLDVYSIERFRDAADAEYESVRRVARAMDVPLSKIK